MRNGNFDLNSLGSLLLLIYFHKKLDKNANVANFVYYGKNFNRFCRFYRTMRELKISKMLLPLWSEPRHLWHFWLSSPVCYPLANFPVCCKSQFLCSEYVVLMSSCSIDFGLRLFLINRAWIHQELQGFQDIGKIMKWCFYWYECHEKKSIKWCVNLSIVNDQKVCITGVIC